MSGRDIELAPRAELMGVDEDFRGQTTALEAVTRAEVDIQVSTAKRFPRSIERFIKEATGLVSRTPQVASQCIYTLPARRGGNGQESKPITGPSIRLAEIAASCWGNLRITGSVVDDDGQALTLVGMAHDLQTNVAHRIEIKRGIVRNDGKRYSLDMINMTANAGIAIATRNAILKVIPRAFVAELEEAARAVIRGEMKTLSTRVNDLIGWFAKKGIAEKQLFAILGVPGKADISLDHLETASGYRTAILDNSLTVEELLSHIEPAEVVTPEAKAANLTAKVAAAPDPIQQGTAEAPFEAKASEVVTKPAQEPKPSTKKGGASGQLPIREPGSDDDR